MEKAHASLAYQCRHCHYKIRHAMAFCPLCHRYGALRDTRPAAPVANVPETFKLGETFEFGFGKTLVLPSRVTLIRENAGTREGEGAIVLNDAAKIGGKAPENRAVRVATVDRTRPPRVTTGCEGLDHVLGDDGGVGAVLGSVVIFSADPGSGKSTVATIVSHHFARVHGLPSLYASGEETPERLAIRCDRLALALDPDEPYEVLHSNVLEEIVEVAIATGARFVAVDSLGVLRSRVEMEPKERMKILCEFAQRYGVFVLVVNHVTKDGVFGGDMATIHEADVAITMTNGNVPGILVLGYGDPPKNRWGATTRHATLRKDHRGIHTVRTHDIDDHESSG